MSPPPVHVITPFPDQTTSHSPPPAIHYPEWLSTPELITRAHHQERRGQSAAHAVLITQTSQLMGWRLMDAIQVFHPHSPNTGTTPPPPWPNRPSPISDEEEEMLVNNIVDSSAPIPICLCPIDLVPYSPTPSLQHDLHLIDCNRLLGVVIGWTNISSGTGHHWDHVLTRAVLIDWCLHCCVWWSFLVCPWCYVWHDGTIRLGSLYPHCRFLIDGLMARY